MTQANQDVSALQVAAALQPQPQEKNVEQATALCGNLCIHQIVEAYARQQPESLAVADARESLTYRELNAQANQIARYLQQLGHVPRQPVGIYMQQSVRAVVSMLGVLKAGSAYVPIDTGYPLSRVLAILEEADSAIVLTQTAVRAPLIETAYTLVDLDEDRQLIAQHSPENLDYDSNERDLAYIIFTSGSTGKPKGVEIEHRSLRNLVGWHQQEFQVTARDRATLFASISFDASVWELWPYLCSGASVSVVPAQVRDSLARWQSWMLANQITLCFLPTPLAEQVIKLEWSSPLPLRMLLTGGDRLHSFPPSTLPFTLVNNYGPTENTVVATSCIVPPDPGAASLPSIGKPVTNVEIYILDDAMQPVPIGTAGELYIAGASLARGYCRQPRLTEERFLPHPFSADPQARLYKTGDQASRNADGTITFLGRNDHQVKVRGFRIELAEIEAALAAHPAMQECCALSVPIDTQENQLIAFFVPREQATPSVDDLQDYLKGVLPDYMIPTRFTQLEALPLSASGKVDRQQLAALSALVDAPLDVVVGTNETEQQLIEIWRDLLKGRRFGLHDDFFKIGGHSLSVLQLIVRVRKLFSVTLTVRDIFQNPTIVKLSTIIQDKQSAKVRP
ncbi:MAG TPA: non-ribosomal peptide synthetase [Ktedonobacteraceae bacterium]|jgi:amino acid adenylation domain-containing protein